MKWQARAGSKERNSRGLRQKKAPPDNVCQGGAFRGRGGIRTPTPENGNRILSPMRLPFRHSPETLLYTGMSASNKIKFFQAQETLTPSGGFSQSSACEVTDPTS